MPDVLGEKAGRGFTLYELQKAVAWCRRHDIKHEIWDLRPDDELDLPPAYLLIMRKCADHFVDSKLVYDELANLDWDKHGRSRYGTVVNKLVRYNLTFASIDREPNYENAEGRIISWKHLPNLSLIKAKLFDILGDKAWNMI